MAFYLSQEIIGYLPSVIEKARDYRLRHECGMPNEYATQRKSPFDSSDASRGYRSGRVGLVGFAQDVCGSMEIQNRGICDNGRRSVIALSTGTPKRLLFVAK